VKIRPEQIRKLAYAQEAEFGWRMVRHLSEDLPKDCERQGLRKDQLEAFVCEQMANARQHGIESGLDLKTYIQCAAVYGRAFDRDPSLPWATAVLGRSDLAAGGKADLLHDHLIFRR
jgi:hypothetical protein